MRIRTRLVVVFLLLAVLPLTAIVLYSYVSSLQAVRKAIEEETLTLASEMDDRMATIRDDLGAGVARVSELPFASAYVAADGGNTDTTAPDSGRAASRTAPEFAGRVVQEIGPAASFLESLEFIPSPTPTPPQAPAPPVVVRAPVPDVPDAAGLDDIEIAFESPEHAGEDQAKANGSASREAHPIVIRIPEILTRIESVPGISDEDRENIRKGMEVAIHTAQVKTHAAMSEEMRRKTEEQVASAIENVAAAREKAHEDFIRQWKMEWVESRSSDTGEGQNENEATTATRSELRDFEVPVFEDGEVIGQVRARVSGDEVIRRILASTERASDEIPFAIDANGRLYVATEEDRPVLTALPIESLTAVDDSRTLAVDPWVIAANRDPDSGMLFCIARPISDSIEEVRKTAVRNFGFGMGLVIVALIGVIPLANHLTRDISLVTDGARKVASGELGVEVSVKSSDEVGELADAFNRMSRDLGEQQRRLVEEERHRQQQELRQRLLEVEFDRKTRELEDAREFQLSLLPKKLPSLPAYEIAVHMKTATEVGGDYYDFRATETGDLIAVIGDATGHGARAGTMVTVIKSLFAGWADDRSLSGFLRSATDTIRQMQLGRMAMAFSIARLEGSTMTIANAGMPPILVHRAATGEVEEIAQQGMPLGTLDFPYEEQSVAIGPGDTIFMMSDGFPELVNALGEPLGYTSVESRFLEAASESPERIIAHLAAAADAWSNEPHDDITFVVIRRVFDESGLRPDRT